MRRALLPAAVALLLLAGCGGGGSPKQQGLVAGLESHGVKAETPQPEPAGVLGVRSTAYQVPGGQLHVFTFPSGPEAQKAAARVLPDGYTVQTVSGINQAVDWAAPPHWFRDGREIALYVGTSSDVVDALRTVAGTQFAGA